MKVSAIVLALFLETSSATKITTQNKEIHDDSTNVGISVDLNDENTSIASLAQAKNKMQDDAAKVAVSAEKQKRMENLRQEINKREGSEKNMSLFKNINDKLQDKSFIEQAIESTTKVGAQNTPLKTTITNESRPNDQVRNSEELYHTDQSQHDRNTDTMSEFHKDWEQNYNQGNHNTGTTNAPRLQADHISLPNAWTRIAPVNQPKHLDGPDFKPADAAVASGSGISLAYMTVDSEEHATRFIKDLFKEGLIAAVQTMDGGFSRSYLKFGTPSTENKRVRMEMTVPDGRVANLINYVNNNNPTQYDYPVPDVTVIPVVSGNAEYIKWAKASGKVDFSKIDYAHYPSETE